MLSSLSREAKTRNSGSSSPCKCTTWWLSDGGPSGGEGGGSALRASREGSVSGVLGEGAITPTQHLSATHVWTPGYWLLPPGMIFP